MEADETEENLRGVGFGSLKLKGLTALKRLATSIVALAAEQQNIINKKY